MSTAASSQVRTTSSPTVPGFAVTTGAQVREVLDGRESEILRLVEDAYLLHCNGDSVNPPSYFLRFPDRPSSRIIALPASVGGDLRVDGLKWVSSFPGNVDAGIPRASAVLILNDRDTGFPFACLEGSVISATRTAAMATLAADRLTDRSHRPRRIGFIGTGLIARYIHRFLAGTGWSYDEIGLHDVSSDSTSGFRGYLERTGAQGRISMFPDAETLIRSSEIVVFATVAGAPYVSDPGWFSHNPLVLHVSLRDLAPEVILSAANLVDDVEHCMRAETSPHLTEQRTGSRDFLAGTLGDVLIGRIDPPRGRPLVFSPFGLGVLDLAVGKYVYDQLIARGDLRIAEGFFDELNRYG